MATLLLQANRVVSRQRISDAIWGDSPPHHPTDQIHGCVYRLRRQLVLAGAPTSIIATDQAGYQVRVDAQSLDLMEFRGLREQARAAAASGESEEARARYRAALNLWRGPALDGIDSDAIRRTAAALDEEHLQASEERIELELALGETTELVTELTELVQEHPYRENLHGNLMLALYRAGRQADALAAYRHARRLLDDELGTEPSSDLQELHRAILNRDEDLALSRRHSRPRRADPIEFQPVPPQTMPPDIPDFVGREPELRELHEQLASRSGNSVAVLVISGPAGVGKTALSVHLAHVLRGEYPDGTTVR